MRAVVQRVSRAEVRIDGEVAGRIGPGLMILVGAGHGDGASDVEWLADKIVSLRIFPDEAGLMNRSVAEAGGGLLVISQFTLYGDCRKGRRPSFTDAMPPGPAEALYEGFLARLRSITALAGLPVEKGRFGADMKCELVNDGPVTLLLDSKKTF